MRAASLCAYLLCAATSAAASASARPPLASGLARKKRENLVLPRLATLTALRGGTVVAGAVSPAGDAPPPAHAVEPEAYLEREGISSAHGLSQSRASQLFELHGPNVLAVAETESLWQLFLAQFDDKLVQILLCVAALSYALARLEGEANGWVEPAVILAILLLNAVVGTWQESSAASALDALQKLQPEQARCLRDGVWSHEMPAVDLVPGDIIELRVGDRVPADARLLSLSTTTLSADEGSLTGAESAK